MFSIDGKTVSFASYLRTILVLKRLATTKVSSSKGKRRLTKSTTLKKIPKKHLGSSKKIASEMNANAKRVKNLKNLNTVKRQSIIDINTKDIKRVDSGTLLKTSSSTETTKVDVSGLSKAERLKRSVIDQDLGPIEAFVRVDGVNHSANILADNDHTLDKALIKSLFNESLAYIEKYKYVHGTFQVLKDLNAILTCCEDLLQGKPMPVKYHEAKATDVRVPSYGGKGT